MRGRILDGDGKWQRIKFLLDTGADRTVISDSVLEAIKLPYVQPKEQIGGVGGLVDSVDVATRIGLQRNDGQWIRLAAPEGDAEDPHPLPLSGHQP